MSTESEHIQKKLKTTSEEQSQSEKKPSKEALLGSRFSYQFRSALASKTLKLVDYTVLVTELQSLVIPFLELHPEVSRLNIGGNYLRNEGAFLLSKNNTLKTLGFENNRIQVEGIQALSLNDTLTCLSLQYDDINDEGAKAIALSNSLTNLSLNLNKIGNQGATALANNEHLKLLNLYDNQIGNAGAKALAMNNSLTSLNVGRNEITESGAIALAGSSSLQTLNLIGNKIGDEGAIALASNCNLRVLQLSQCNIGVEGIIALAKNTSLVELDISENHFGDGAIEALAVNQTLQKLNIKIDYDEEEGNIINLENLRAFMINPNLTELNVSGWFFGDEGAKILANSQSLISLCVMDYHNITNEGVESLINGNNRLQELKFEGDETDLDYWCQVLQSKKQQYLLEKTTFLMGTHERLGANSPILSFYRHKICDQKNLSSLIFSYLKPKSLQLSS